MGNAKWQIRYLVLISAFVGNLVPSCATAQETGSIMPDVSVVKDPKLIYQMDLMTGKLTPIDRVDLKVGYTYYHFSSRLNRWAWSYCQKDGSFWYAFGEGTIQEAWTFDIRASREEISKRLGEFPELARQVDRYNQNVCLQLQSDGRWKIVGTGYAPSIFNVETGERWQMFSKREYVPVVHTYGKAWTFRKGDYYPSNSVSYGR
jgi:hypothetical protein